MIQINMLPWRERAREIKKKNFVASLSIAIGCTLFVIFLFHMYYDDLVRYQDKRNAFLQGQIAQKQVEIDELRKDKEQQAVIQTKLQFLMSLREKGYRAVRLLNELLKVVPDAVTLSKLERNGNAITIEGKAQSELVITAFLKSISEVSIFNQPVLTGISSRQGATESSERVFQIKVEQKEDKPKIPPQKEEEPGLNGQPQPGSGEPQKKPGG
jgi:type IV pilus assembly protein PilN